MKLFIYLFFCTLLFSSSPTGADEIHSVGILLDVSKSVSPQEFETIKEKIQEIAQPKNPAVNLALYIFGNNLQKVNMDQLPSIQATQPNTIFYDALYDVLRDLEKETSAKKSIVIFSDGKDTRSATILNDIVSFAREQKIVIHCVGTGKAHKKLLERLAKLTGGNYFAAENAELVQQIRKTIDVPAVARNTVASPRVVKPQPSNKPPVHSVPAPKIQNSKRWLAAIVPLILIGAIFLLYRRRHQIRVCPTCGKALEPSQLVCSDCPGQTQIRARPEIPAQPPEPKPAPIPRTAPSSHDTQEFLSKTHFLDETPALVVTKGNNVGEKYRLNKKNPVSIGRSRLNEIRPDDPSISAQHCRIIPENGEFVIYDLGSTNGTVVNNINVNMAVLEEGDTIRVGSTTLLFTLTGI